MQRNQTIGNLFTNCIHLYGFKAWRHAATFILICFGWQIVLISITSGKVSILYATRSDKVMQSHACNNDFRLLMKWVGRYFL